MEIKVKSLSNPEWLTKLHFILTTSQGSWEHGYIGSYKDKDSIPIKIDLHSCQVYSRKELKSLESGQNNLHNLLSLEDLLIMLAAHDTVWAKEYYINSYQEIYGFKVEVFLAALSKLKPSSPEDAKKIFNSVIN